MRANEFVKKFGLSKAKKIVIEFNYNSRNKFITSLKDNSAINIYDLKRLVESHEFVSANGGIDEAMKYINSQDPNGTSKHYNALREKVADVESCL